MEYPKEGSISLYDYSDKSIPHAGYAAIVYGVISLVTGLFALLQYFLYHTPGQGGFLYHDYANQQWLRHTPLVTAISVVFSVIIAAIFGVLAFGIFRRNRFSIVAMIFFVVIL